MEKPADEVREQGVGRGGAPPQGSALSTSSSFVPLHKHHPGCCGFHRRWVAVVTRHEVVVEPRVNVVVVVVVRVPRDGGE